MNLLSIVRWLAYLTMLYLMTYKACTYYGAEDDLTHGIGTVLMAVSIAGTVWYLIELIRRIK